LNKSEVAFDLYTTATEPCGDLFTIDLCRQVEPWIIKKKSAAGSNSYMEGKWMSPGSGQRGENAAPFLFL